MIFVFELSNGLFKRIEIQFSNILKIEIKEKFITRLRD